MYYLDIDWATDKHDLCFMTPDGHVLWSITHRVCLVKTISRPPILAKGRVKRLDFPATTFAL